MTLTAEERSAVRGRIGTTEPPTDADLDAIHNTLGDVDAVVLRVLQQRYADMLARPADLSVDGDFHEKWGENLKALREQIDGLAAEQGDPNSGAFDTGQLVRRRPR